MSAQKPPEPLREKQYKQQALGYNIVQAYMELSLWSPFQPTVYLFIKP